MFKRSNIFFVSITAIIFFISCSENEILQKSTITSKNNDSVTKSCCEKLNRIKLLDNSIEIDFNSIDSINLNISHDSNNKKMILVNGGEFMMGASDEHWSLRREFPRHGVKVNSFLMDIHEVTNKEFMEFTKATGYVTTAEKKVEWEILKKQLPPGTPKPDDSLLAPGSLVFFQPKKNISNTLDFSQWWKWIKGANWKNPYGPGSNINGIEYHPVVHISYEDAFEYAKWSGKRLPTEAEWEWAARGGLKNCIYPWGNEHVENGKIKCNFWEGNFPKYNSKKDGFLFTSPVMSYDPNGYGLYDMAGNVWEICSDWYDESYYSTLSKNKISDNPKGPNTWKYSREPYDPKKVIRGGSFLCNDSYCASYRVSARMPYSMDTGMSHTGFRCVKDI